MSDERKRANRALLVSLARTFQRMQSELSSVVRQDGVTPSQWDVLAILHIRGPQTVNGLIERCLTSSGNIDVVLRNLIGKGLVTKQVDDSDARKRVVAITSEGADYVQSAMPAHEEAHEALFGALTLRERKELRTLLKKITIQRSDS